MARVALPNFSKGEIAPDLYGRIDTSQYSAGLKTARNFMVQRYGGVTFRPGTRFVAKVDDPTKPVRLIPFQFSISQSYVMVMGQGSMRPAALGGMVLEQNTKITAATQANPCVLTIPFHGYSDGDRIYLSGIEGMVELNGRFVTVTYIDDDNISIGLDSTNFTAFVSSDGTENVAAPDPPPADPVVEDPVDPPDTPPTTPDGGGGGYEPPYWRDPYYKFNMELF